MSRYLPPGSTIGIIGGGQLGRMTAIAARQMGYRVAVLDPDRDCPAGQVADHVVARPYADHDAARDIAERSDVVTYEFENVEATAVEAAAEVRPVYPSPHVLRVCQHRLREKAEARAAGVPVTPFAAVRSLEDMARAIREIGVPGVLKTATMGYDGKGQVVVRDSGDSEAAFLALEGRSEALIYERFVDFSMELSVICTRTEGGETLCFPPSENIHRNNILDVSIVPARAPQEVLERAQGIACSMADHMGVVGLLCVEMFLARDGGLLLNEMAPRPHNSGHWSIEGCATSQFEQLVRVLCGLPLGSVDLRSPSVMVNLLGDIWAEAGGTPDFRAALEVPGASLHLYGKTEARQGRKMGHITVGANDVEEALERAKEARRRLVGRHQRQGRRVSEVSE